ncbi:hypothetical protein HFN_1780 [Helicobacter fennelliae MRY12-0050]|uniref:Uncharacterized protein n=1 Tax=Helicobacter fennelliae MRY12-0050 TaxID=1325130 RepID=T1DV28_9HELI|nr:hypothetical protein HFN_1780 [Helicobacter fennelliae MRY12-0050]
MHHCVCIDSRLDLDSLASLRHDRLQQGLFKWIATQFCNCSQ